MNIHHMVAKAIDFKNTNPAKAIKIIDITATVVVFFLVALLFKSFMDSHKLVELRLNDLHHIANWMIIKSVATMAVLATLLGSLLFLGDKIRKELEVLDEIEEI